MSRPTMNVCYWMQSGLKVAIVIIQTGPPARDRYVAFYGQEQGRERHGVFRGTEFTQRSGGDINALILRSKSEVCHSQHSVSQVSDLYLDLAFYHSSHCFPVIDSVAVFKAVSAWD